MADYLFIPKDDGTEEQFEIIYEFERHDTGQKYIMVVQKEDDEKSEEEKEVFAFRYSEENDQIELEMIEDDQEWEIVEEVFEDWLTTGDTNESLS